MTSLIEKEQTMRIYHDHQAPRDTIHAGEGIDRRRLLKTGVAGVAGAGAAAIGFNSGNASAAADPYAPPAKPALPPSDMKLDLPRTALVVTDPQIDFLSPNGVT